MRHVRTFVLQGILCQFFLISFLFAAPITKGPYLSQPTTQSIVIKWITEVPLKGIMRFGAEGNLNRWVTDSTACTTHVIHLKNLSPNTHYFYRILNGDDSTQTYSFWTAPDGSSAFTFVVYGDTRSNHQAHQEILRLAVEQAPRFALHTGDVVQNGKKHSNWDSYFKDLCLYTRAGEMIPIYYAIGNHERHGSLYYAYFELPQNNSLNTEEFYSFQYGTSHFIALSSEMPFQKGTYQYQWLEKDLKDAVPQSDWIFVFFHRPPYSSGEHGSSRRIRKAWHPLFKKYGVTAVFNGHDHLYERTHSIDGVTYFVTGGGGAPLYSFKPHKWTAHVESVYHLVRVDVAQKQVHFRMIRWDGTIGDDFTCQKGSFKQAEHVNHD